MDDFVRNKLTEWGLSEWIDRFKDEYIDEESFYCLDIQELKHLIPKSGPRAKFKKRFKLLKGKLKATQERDYFSVQCKQEPEEEEAELPGVLPSTSITVKRPLDHDGESSRWEPPAKRQRDCRDIYSEASMLSEVKNIMRDVQQRLQNQENTKLNAFLKAKINDLETDKRELVGVFGRSGAGKSSLINAIIGERDLLPTGSISACTTVMIKVEANMQDSNYKADIEFITKEEWKEELWSLDQLRGDNSNQKRDDDEDEEEEVDDDDDDDNDSYDFDEKLSALYGEEYKNKTSEELMDKKYFKEISEFLNSSRKTFTCQSAKELSTKLFKYTRSESGEDEGQAVKRFYWPLVKCVTVKVPHNEFLQHVTLVDLPGNGDCNKSRDQMWKEIVSDCSTVWIVTDINRATTEKEPWEILKNASSHMGNGGECQQIHFICTKSDQIGDLDDNSAAQAHAHIQKRNNQAKRVVRNEFSKQSKIKKLFGDRCFDVFTVSSKEFLKRTPLVDTEIPKLKEFLQNLNDSHSETLNYVSGAYGILSLIQGARCRGGAGSRTDVCADLEKHMCRHLHKVKTTMDEANKAFVKCLTEGVEKSKISCEKKLKSFLLSRKGGGGFYGTLKCVVQNKGVHKTQKGKQINLNVTLSSHLTDSIDEEFKKTFPNGRQCEPFKGVISRFSLNTDRLIQKYKDVELQLIFLQTEEKKIKTKLKKDIRDRKKKIYNSLTKKIEENMQKCYDKAYAFTGKGSLKKMRETIQRHVYNSKNVMFDQAKDAHLNLLKQLKIYVLKTLETTMMKSIELSLKTDDSSIPDVSKELAVVKRYCDQLKVDKNESDLQAEAWSLTEHP
ncbi:nuclear GTPase SLIP-GC-like [Mugil cephalus]|uniref:nuclear GTPase SLIP-GC-like n=1 Tax=Mugil cephalus TaxID=48193 RepID=UPI001FB78711|nr:nuclear GTPase SLIP-GC-like [Mugil cephalus]